MITYAAMPVLIVPFSVAELVELLMLISLMFWGVPFTFITSFPVTEESVGVAELVPYLQELIKYSKETAEKELILGDREIAKANLRGQSSMGFSLITEG